MRRRTLLAAITAGLSGCQVIQQETTPTPTTEDEPTETVAIDLPADGALDGWHTFRGSVTNQGRAAGVTGPGPAVEPAWDTAVRSGGDDRLLSAAGGVVFSAGKWGVEAIDAADGTQLAAQVTPGHEITTEPVMVDGHLFAGTWESGFVCIDPTTGQTVWQASTSTLTHHNRERLIPVTSTPAIAENQVYFGNSGPEGGGAFLRCYSIEGGETCWREWPNVGSLGVEPPRVVGDRVLLDEGTELVALSLEDQSVEWRVPFPETDRSNANYRPLAPAVAEGVAAVATNGGLVGVDIGAGERQWTIETRSYAPDSTYLANTYTPAIHDGTVYAGLCDGGFGAYDLASGEEQWTATPDPPVIYWTAPAIGNGCVFVGAQGPENVPYNPGDRDPDDARLYAFDRETGEQYGPWSLPGHLRHPVVTDDSVVIASGNSLYAFN
ncbi:outer membrane protein assembly factor BamB family protein [Halococcoides cellulosivorans]|nr:PQQ-binding-like beta-propeller repeat protein [Halococcoides cellulosivorans]